MTRVFVDIGLSLAGCMAPEGMTMGREIGVTNFLAGSRAAVSDFFRRRRTQRTAAAS